MLHFLFVLANAVPRANCVAFGCHAQQVCCFLHFLLLVACIVTNCNKYTITIDIEFFTFGCCQRQMSGTNLVACGCHTPSSWLLASASGFLSGRVKNTKSRGSLLLDEG